MLAGGANIGVGVLVGGLMMEALGMGDKFGCIYGCEFVASDAACPQLLFSGLGIEPPFGGPILAQGKGKGLVVRAHVEPSASIGHHDPPVHPVILLREGIGCEGIRRWVPRTD